MDLRNRVPFFMNYCSGYMDTVSGVSPLSLPKAKANSLQYVKAFGGTEQSGTPTPTQPIDIVSNNGVLKARHQSGLPLGYTLLEYIDTDGDSWLDTGITPTATTLQFDYKMQILQQEFVSFFGAVAATTPRYGFRAYYQPLGGATNILNWQSGSFLVQQTITWNDVLQGTVIATQGVSVVSTINGTTQTYNSSAIDLTQSDTMFLGTTHLGTTSGLGPTRIWSFKITKDGTLVQNLVPAKNSSNVIGMYDLVSGQFFTNAGTGTFTAGNPVSDPVEIYTDGTVETIEDTIGNTATAEMLLKVGDYQDIQSIIDGVVTRKVGVKVFDGTEGFDALSRNVVTKDKNALGMSNAANATTVVSSHFIYAAYTPSQSINNGFFISSTGIVGFSTSAIGNTATAVNDWLAAQYAAGTPVIVVYPLDTATTEQVTGQTLQVQAGNNTLEITQASLNNLTLEAKYKRSK